MSVDGSEPDAATPLIAAEDVLAMVIIIVPLPANTAAALRLTCQTTRMAVDQATRELAGVSAGVPGLLRSVGAPLASGITSLRFRDDPGDEDNDRAVSNAVALSITNAKQLVTLQLPQNGGNERHVRLDTAALSMLGTCQWPALQSLVTFSVPSIFSKIIQIDSMPSLTEFSLRGALGSADLTAMCASERFTANLEILELENGTRASTAEDYAYFRSLKKLLQATQRLRCLVIDDAWKDLDFLADVDLPYLETFHFSLLYADASMAPITSVPRPRLRSLTIIGSEATPEDLTPLLHADPALLPALQDLYIDFVREDAEYLREITLTTLTSLSISQRCMTIDALDDLAAALPRLPALESLFVRPLDIYRTGAIGGEQGMAALLSGPPLRRLKRLQMDGNWENMDGALFKLIQGADKLPELEELVMRNARVSHAGFRALAVAGLRGLAPGLKLFQIGAFAEEGEEYAGRLVSILGHGYPWATVKVGDRIFMPLGYEY